MSLKRFIPRSANRFSYANQLSKRILKAGRWRANLRKQAEVYGDGRAGPGFQFSHLLVGGTWLWVIASILFAGILHICAILFLPHLATKSGWARISDLTPLNQILVLPGGVAGKEVLPRMAPDIRYAFCRYSLENGPIRLTVPMASDLWTVSLHTPQGDNFYTISGADVQRGQATFIISAAAPQIVDSTKKSQLKSDSEFSIAPAPKTGLVVIRAPLQGAADLALTNELMTRTNCAPDTLKQASKKKKIKQVRQDKKTQ